MEDQINLREIENKDSYIQCVTVGDTVVSSAVKITRDMTLASGAVTTAHGLGKVPTLVKGTAILVSANGRPMMSFATYDGTNTKQNYFYENATPVLVADTITTNFFTLVHSSGNSQIATIAVDATNITLTWTKAGTPTDAAYILLESESITGNYGYILTARQITLQIIGVSEKHTAAGTDGGAVTLDVVKVPDGSAISAGTSILASTFNLKSTANTNVYKEGKNLSVAADIRYLQIGESLALKTTGVMTGVAGVQVCVYYKLARKGSYK